MKLDQTDSDLIKHIGTKESIRAALFDAKRSELLSLYDSGIAEHLDSSLETLLEEHPEDEIIRLLWSDSQAQLDILPLSFIASSLYEVLQKGNVLENAARLSFIISSKLCLRLIKDSEFRIGLLLAGIFINLEEGRFLNSSQEQKEWHNLAQALIDKEKEDAVRRKENKSYHSTIEDLESKLSKIKDNPLETNIAEHSNKTNSEVLDIKLHSLKEFTLGEPSTHGGFEKTRSFSTRESKIADEGINNSRKSHDLIIKPNPNSHKRNIILISICLFLTLCGAVLILKSKDTSLLAFIYNSSNEHSNKIIFEFSKSTSPNPSFSKLPPFYQRSTDSSLESINIRLRNINVDSNPSPKKPESNNTLSLDEKSIAKAENTIDEYEIESLDSIPESESLIREAKPIPTLPVNRALASSQTNSSEDLGSNERKESIHPGKDPKVQQIKPKADGRTYGPPQIVDPASGRGSERALDGSPLKSYEVERYDPPHVYETLTATNVLASPSLLSASITRLEAHTPIQVTAKMGFWLEIRSNEGRTGYIYAQDASTNPHQ